MTKVNVATSLRDKYTKEIVSKVKHISLSETPGFHSLKDQFFLFESVFLQNYSIFNQSAHKAILLCGIPGVGKSFAANAIASQLNKPIIHCDEIVSSFRKAESLKPSILIIEDVDSFEEKQAKLLCEMLDSLKKEVLVIGTAKSQIKESLKRNDRFEIEILLKTPSVKEREEIISYLLFKEKKEEKERSTESLLEDFKKTTKVSISKIKEKKEENENKKSEKNEKSEKNFEVDVKKVADFTPGFLPSDLIKLIRLSCTFALKNKEKKLTTERITETIQKVKKIDSKLTFDCIGALEEVKEILNLYVIFPTLYPNLFRRMGLSKPSGVLLYGPPGCGKTMLARAVSNMCHSNFICISGPELISKYVGDSEKEIRDLFDKARSLSPCVIFFDEIDSLCTKRSDSGFNNRIVNQMLTLMDGINLRGEVYLLAATNRIDVLDEALLRPGRFDKIIKVTLPKKEECLEIFKKVSLNIPMESFDYEDLHLEGLSGAEISGVVREAGLLAMKRDFSEKSFISKDDILEALRRKVEKEK